MNKFVYHILFLVFSYNLIFICAYQPLPPELLKQNKSSETVVASDKQNINTDTDLEKQGSSHLENLHKTPYTSEVKRLLGESEGGVVNISQITSKNDLEIKTDVSEQNILVNYNDLKNKEPNKSSVVPRKGAPTIDLNLPLEDKTNVTQTKQNSYNLPNNTKNTPGNIDLRTNLTQNGASNNLAIINKKPESASDFTEDDADTFIESSSTGKDYVLTGVAIFICLWAVIFVALFFYKRAGELWDRRHYRRMDFLVEGTMSRKNV